MLVVGTKLNYTKFGGIVVGYQNSATGRYSLVSGGFANTASGDSSSVSGGNMNTVSGPYSSISGGYNNTASGASSSISGGSSGTVRARYDWQQENSLRITSASAGVVTKFRMAR